MQTKKTFSSTPVQNYIDNAHTATANFDQANSSIPIFSPATAQILSYLPLSTKTDVDTAVKSSTQAFSKWSTLTTKARVQYLIRFHQLVVSHADELADLIVLEHGKTKLEALAEVAKGNETVEYAISMPILTLGHQLEVSRGITCHDCRSPLGVVVSIVPFNFPFMVPFWTIAIAIACGNVMIIKPSEKVPLTMSREAGLPDGVVNLVNGGRETVEALVDHPDVRAVTFVGTSLVAESLSKRCRNLNKRIIALGGAKNHLVAAPDSIVDMTAQDVVNSFAGCSGQRCMAASVLLTIGDQPKLIDEIVLRASKLTAGQEINGQMGPVIDQQSKDKIIKYINESEIAGAKILLDGRKWGPNEGFWVGPTIILHSNRKDKALHDEIFGPVLSILPVKSKEEAIEIENANPYGNAACIYTRDGGVAEWFTKRFTAGMIGVNVGVPVPREPFSFGGIGRSKFGDGGDVTGSGAVDFFTERRKVTTKWAQPAENSLLNW